MPKVKVVAKYGDGQMLKGHIENFSPTSRVLHVFPCEAADPTQCTEVLIDKLKALFFVKDFDGHVEYDERKAFDPATPVQGKKLSVTLNDGEVVVGSSLNYVTDAPGFFLFPADPNSNNEKVFIVSSFVDKIEAA